MRKDIDYGEADFWRNFWLALIVLILVLQTCEKTYGQKWDPSCGKNPYGAGHLIDVSKKHSQNTVFAVFQPYNIGYGLGYHRVIWNDIGVYGLATHGSYDVQGSVISVPHTRITIGGSYGAQVEKNIRSFVLAGITHNTIYISKRNYPELLYALDKDMPFSKAKHISFELGAGITLINWFTTQFRYDPLRTELGIDVGISF